MPVQFHATVLVDLTFYRVGFKNTFHSEKRQVFYRMALSWVVGLVFAWGCAAQNNSESLSQRCENDINTFLRELNLERPEEYAVLSK